MTHNPPTDVAVQGGRTEGLERLSKAYLQRRCRRYDLERDTPGQEHTTRLSAHLKYGCVSFREAHLAALTALKGRPKASEALTRELFWAAFYAYITYHFPHVLAGQGVVAGANQELRKTTTHRALQTATTNQPLRTALHGKLASVWDGGGSAAERERRWRAWTTGTTGYPFVDAAMRQLLTTGWMHNRARMVVANFLTKDLRIDWREGERHFATRLVDYDPSSNSGGWQWASATGADAQPYHRVFNPWTQGVKFDADAAYVHLYVPELKTVPAEALAVGPCGCAGAVRNVWVRGAHCGARGGKGGVFGGVEGGGGVRGGHLICFFFFVGVLPLETSCLRLNDCSVVDARFLVKPVRLPSRKALSWRRIRSECARAISWAISFTSVRNWPSGVNRWVTITRRR